MQRPDQKGLPERIALGIAVFLARGLDGSQRLRGVMSFRELFSAKSDRRVRVIKLRRNFGQTAAMSAIHAEGFDSTRTVVLEKDAGPAVGDPIAVGTQPEAKVTGYGPNEILLETNAATNGVLFLSEVYYPGWRAWVDGNEVEVLRADYVFRAIGLPAGSHHVRFLYDPLSFRVGELIFVVTGLVLLGWLPLQEWIRRRKRPT